TRGDVVRGAGEGACLAGDFSLDGAPDPRVGLGKDGKYDEATDMGELRSITGLQAYAVPDGVDVSGYNEVYIWCRKFSVPLGVASLD
ncbi:MAG: DM13 domain-containing protein, partial [Pseudomonadota bacterium]